MVETAYLDMYNFIKINNSKINIYILISQMIHELFKKKKNHVYTLNS